LQKGPRECEVRRFMVCPSQIHFLRFILEAYEGVGVVTTLDPQLGLVELKVARGCEEVADKILESEKVRLQLRKVTSFAD
jgi:hypothetical protein